MTNFHVLGDSELRAQNYFQTVSVVELLKSDVGGHRGSHAATVVALNEFTGIGPTVEIRMSHVDSDGYIQISLNDLLSALQQLAADQKIRGDSLGD